MGRYDALTHLEEKPTQTTPSLAPSSPTLKKPIAQLVKKQGDEGEKANISNDPKTGEKTSLLANQQTSKLVKKQTSLPANLQASKETNQQTSELANLQTGKQSLSTKEKKKYGTYLREDSISQIQVCAIQTKRKDHEVLQDIVDFYFAQLKS
jgi:hypothetical protein